MVGRMGMLMATTVVSGLAVTALAAPASAAASSTTPTTTSRAASVLRVGSSLPVGVVLRSPNGAYTATLRAGGRLVLAHGTRIVWSTHAHGSAPRLRLRTSGNLVITSKARVLWASGTAGSKATRLVLNNVGTLALYSSGGTPWTNHVGNACAHNSGKRVTINLSTQFARLCSNSQQVLATSITSGATAVGDGTPTGTWHLQSKQRDRYLYPASGGAYFVHYWLPYDGAYGMHDSSWQKFPYGSSKYRTNGSHGCVHFPRAAIAWMYNWAPIGTTVHIHA